MFFYADRMWRATNVGTSAFEVIDGIEVNQPLGLFLKTSKIFKSLIKKSLFNKEGPELFRPFLPCYLS
jgi:hypothetical protein